MANLEQPGSGTPKAGSVTRTLPLIVAFHLTKTENRTKNADVSKIKGLMILKGIFLKLKMQVYLHTRFHVSSVILTGFGQEGGAGGILSPPTEKRTSKNPTQTRVNI